MIEQERIAAAVHDVEMLLHDRDFGVRIVGVGSVGSPLGLGSVLLYLLRSENIPLVDKPVVDAMSRAAALAADFWAAVPPRRELPEAEQEIWRSLGAKFKGRPDTVVAAATAAAMEQLRSESLVGNRAVSKLLGVDPSRISQLTADRALYFFEDAAERYFPRWQFVEHRTLPGLRTVIAAVDQAVHPLSLTH
jgi:hypothetical protein